MALALGPSPDSLPGTACLCSTGSAGIPERLPQGVKGPAQPCPMSQGCTRQGRALGQNSVVPVNACTGVPSQWPAGCHHSLSPSAGLEGSQERAGVLWQWARRAFEAGMDAWLMSHLLRGQEGVEGWGKAPKGFPARLSPHTVPGCLCVPSHPITSAHVLLKLPGVGRERLGWCRQPGTTSSLPGACPCPARREEPRGGQ